MLPAIVLDKNFLQGASASSVRALSLTHRLVMPGALFFELLTTTVIQRQRCFAKLPQTTNPVELVEHIGVLLQHEIKFGAPAGQPSHHRLQLAFQFNHALLDPDYLLPKEAADTIADMEATTEREVDSLIELSDHSPDLFPGLLQGTTQAQRDDYRDVQRLIADPVKVHDFYSGLEAPDPRTPFPRIESTLEAWALIRWLQVKMLFATDLYVRYRGQLRQQLTVNVRRQIEHDVHDAQIVALGVLEGALATKEKKLREWFMLLTPRATLLP